MATNNDGLFSVLKNGLITGFLGAATTSAVIAAYGAAKTGNAWTPFNGISHMLLGEEAASKEGFVPRETLLGLGLNGAALVSWGILYEALAGKIAFPQSLLSSTAATGIIYALDYHILPQKLRPGFEKRLGSGAIVAAYAALAATLAVSPLWKKEVAR